MDDRGRQMGGGAGGQWGGGGSSASPPWPGLCVWGGGGGGGGAYPIPTLRTILTTQAISRDSDTSPRCADTSP